MFETAPFRLTANLLRLGKVSEKVLDTSNCFLFSFRYVMSIRSKSYGAPPFAGNRQEWPFVDFWRHSA
jgi:hypothetical protein